MPPIEKDGGVAGYESCSEGLAEAEGGVCYGDEEVDWRG